MGVPLLLALMFKLLRKVPAADEALIVTGGAAVVLSMLQKAQYPGLKADKALLDVEGVDTQRIPARDGPGGLARTNGAQPPGKVTPPER